MVPPVNLLLLKVTKRQLRWSKAESFSTRMGNGRRLKRARVRKIDVRYPSSPQLLNRRSRRVATSAEKPILSRFMK